MRNNDKDDGQKVRFQKNKKAIDKHADPKALAEHLSSHLQEYAGMAPNIAQGLTTSSMNAQQFLQSKLPQAANSLPLSGEHKPSRTSMAKFNHYYETVNDPLSVFSHVREGTLRNEHVETLQTVYPKLYDEMKRKVVEHMDAEKAKALPYSTKLAIGKFMGQPMDASMLPQSIMSNQAALSGPRLGSQGEAQTGRATLGGLKELKDGSRAATETDRQEEDQA